MYFKVDPELRAAKIAEWNRPIWWPVVLIVLVARRRHRAGVPQLEAARARNRGAHARAPKAADERRHARAAIVLNYIVRRIGYARADPDRRQPADVHAVLRGQLARQHCAAQHRRQARVAGRDREVEGRARLRQAAVVQRRRPTASTRFTQDDLLRPFAAALHAGLRHQRQRARHRARDRHPDPGEPRAGRADAAADAVLRHRVLAAAGVLPRQLPRLLGHGACAS